MKKDFLICLPPKAGTSNWQIAFAKLFKTKKEMAARGVILEDDSKKNVFYPDALYGFVPRYHTVKHAALLQGTGKRFLNTRDPFTRARSGKLTDKNFSLIRSFQAGVTKSSVTRTTRLTTPLIASTIVMSTRQNWRRVLLLRQDSKSHLKNGCGCSLKIQTTQKRIHTGSRKTASAIS